MKKFIATGAAIAFAATLTSCEMKKEVETNEEANSPEVNMEITGEMENMPEEISVDGNIPPAQQDPRMQLFEEKQAEMSKLFQEFEQNTPEFKVLQDEINAIFTSGEAIGEEQMKKIEEIDAKIRELFTPEMKALDEELREMGNEIFGQPATPETPVEMPSDENTEMNNEEASNEVMENTDAPMMILE